MSETEKIPPWWSVGHVWLIIAGPAIVVVAAFITLYLAISRPDPVLSPDAPPPDAGQLTKGAIAPALQGRNAAAEHGATAVKP